MISRSAIALGISLVALVALVALVGLGALGGACMTDAKEETCTFDVMLVSGDELYCPDENAPADCEALNDAVVGAAVACSAGAFDEEQLRAALDEEGALQQCDDARATSLTYDACLAHFTSSEPPCAGTSLGPIPETCVGVILQGPA
jgi:hypothetical protein